MGVVYLTEDLKQKFMRELEELPDVDKEIRQYLDKINEAPFICTTQSCWGHPDDGYLSLMVMGDYSSWMELVLLELADMGFDTVTKHECVGENEIRVRYIIYFNDDNRIQLLDYLIKRIDEAKANHRSLESFLVVLFLFICGILAEIIEVAVFAFIVMLPVIWLLTIIF